MFLRDIETYIYVLIGKNYFIKGASLKTTTMIIKGNVFAELYGVYSHVTSFELHINLEGRYYN